MMCVVWFAAQPLVRDSEPSRETPWLVREPVSRLFSAINDLELN